MKNNLKAFLKFIFLQGSEPHPLDASLPIRARVGLKSFAVINIGELGTKVAKAWYTKTGDLHLDRSEFFLHDTRASETIHPRLTKQVIKEVIMRSDSRMVVVGFSHSFRFQKPQLNQTNPDVVPRVESAYGGYETELNKAQCIVNPNGEFILAETEKRLFMAIESAFTESKVTVIRIQYTLINMLNFLLAAPEYQPGYKNEKTVYIPVVADQKWLVIQPHQNGVWLSPKASPILESGNEGASERVIENIIEWFEECYKELKVSGDMVFNIFDSDTPSGMFFQFETAAKKLSSRVKLPCPVKVQRVLPGKDLDLVALCEHP